MTIISGDCLDVMRGMADNSISAIVTDPPYGLHFMGKGWDYAVPGQEYWSECLRIMVPGGNIIAMGGTRTFHRLACAIEDAGYEIRDCISWLYGSGFPKSHNHFGQEGYGTALKPAWEPCLLAMKPLNGTFKQNAEKWGQAGINIDGCRIEGTWSRSTTHIENIKGGNFNNPENGTIEVPSQASHPKGRWPANVIFDEESSRLLDEQSGFSKSISGQRGNVPDIRGNSYNDSGSKRIENTDYCRGHNDSGGASRFFYCAKASSSERNQGLDDIDPIKCGTGALRDNNRGKIAPNSHPTVKPLKLMEYLIKLIMPPKDGILLDPFAGSGTTILAAHRLGMKAIGIEKNAEYAEIARARLEAQTKGQ